MKILKIHLAKGEVMVVDEHFGVKIKEILNREHNPLYFKNDVKPGRVEYHRVN